MGGGGIGAGNKGWDGVEPMKDALKVVRGRMRTDVADDRCVGQYE